jgi:hypothetical protein
MNGMVVFGLELAASLVISAVVVTRLQDLLRRVGAEVCERPGTSAFWVTYTQLMVFIGPLLVIALFSRAGGPLYLNETAQLKSSVLIVLSGHFISLAVVGRAVWKSIFASAAAAAPPAPAPVAAPAVGKVAFAHGGES